MESISLNNDLKSFQPSTEVTNEQITGGDIEHEKEKNNKRHISALLAAAAGRSAVHHAHLHIITNRPGDFAHTGTNISYEN